MGTVRFANLPFETIAKVFEQKWPQKKVDIEFQFGLYQTHDVWGYVEIYPQDDLTPSKIIMDSAVPLHSAVALLIQTLSDVATGIPRQPNKEPSASWYAAMKFIDDEVCKILNLSEENQAWKPLQKPVAQA